jgi:response regulator RpfG family c-di-GMP phosphodiesterase
MGCVGSSTAGRPADRGLRGRRRRAARAEAIAELERGSGSEFDSAVVDAFLDVLAAPVAQPA